jgi:hypothetical protein
MIFEIDDERPFKLTALFRCLQTEIFHNEIQYPCGYREDKFARN